MQRKLVNVRITPNLVECWLKSTGDECIFYSIDGVPNDSKMIDLRYNFEEALFYAVFSHDSFEEVAVGATLPIITPTITTYFV